MKLTEYQNFMEKCIPDEETNLRMLEVLVKGKNVQTAPKRTHGYRYLTAAAVLFLVLALPASVFADDAREFFYGLLKREEGPVNSYVCENVYEDQDEHVKMQVRELVSDGKFAAAVITYEALDEYGKKWLDEEESQEDPLKYADLRLPTYYRFTCLTMESTDAADAPFLSRGQIDNRQLDEFRTETARCFVALAEIQEPSDAVHHYDWQPKLIYRLCNGEKSVILDTPKAPVYQYTLSGPDLLDGRILPSSMELSTLRYRINAEFRITDRTASDDHADPSAPYNDSVYSVVLHFKDGSTITAPIQTRGHATNTNEGKNHLLAASYFFNWFKLHDIDTWYEEENIDLSRWLPELDPSKLTGVEINGNLYQVILRK